MSENGLVPRDIGPGLVRPGMAEEVLERVLAMNDEGDIATLWDGATTSDALAHKWQGHVLEQGEFRRSQLYCEVQLGQVLGPNPGHGGDRKADGRPSRDARLLIPSHVRKHLYRFHGRSSDLIARIMARELQHREDCLRHVARLEASERIREARGRAVTEALPAAVLALDVADARALAESIREVGLLYPIMLNSAGTVLLAGRNRLAACRRASVEPTYATLTQGIDEVAYIPAENFDRRQVGAGQRAMAAARAECNLDYSTRRLARIAGVAHTAIAQARLVLREAREIGGAVRLGLAERREAVKELTDPEGEFHFSQRQAAEVLGIGQKTVSRDLRGESCDSSDGWSLGGGDTGIESHDSPEDSPEQSVEMSLADTGEDPPDLTVGDVRDDIRAAFDDAAAGAEVLGIDPATVSRALRDDADASLEDPALEATIEAADADASGAEFADYSYEVSLADIGFESPDAAEDEPGPPRTNPARRRSGTSCPRSRTSWRHRARSSAARTPTGSLHD